MEVKHENDTSSARPLDIDEQLATSCRHYFDQKITFKPASTPDRYIERLESNYRPLNSNMPEQNPQASPTTKSSGSGKGVKSPSTEDRENFKDGIPSPRRVLYDPSQLEMRWLSPHSVGSGLGNMGNTCFLNSVLQCLTYTPPLFNYLSSDHHKKICRGQGFCAMCELQRHVQRVMNQSGGVVKPVAIVQNLRVIGKHFRQGRQEDAHEFLRYFVDGLQKGSLQRVPAQLDPHSKATTIVHQVFGGYHCSQVRCSKCQKTSETFDPLLDLSLDIKHCTTLDQALARFTKPDSLEGENQYACPYCKKMTPAMKRFTIHRLPNILTVQLKRFDYNSLFGGKINKTVSYPLQLDMRPFMTAKKGPPQWYQLYGVLVHSGYSCRSGHYYCYTKNSNKVWYCLNDAQAYQVSATQALQQEAYLLFYARDHDHQSPPSPAAGQRQPHASPGPSTTADSQSKVRPDPNFLGQPVKHFPHVDKTGTPFVKRKPTGIVPPSPQETSPITTQAPRTFSQAFNTIPLRKTDVDPTPKLAPPPVVVEPPKPTIAPVKKPSFLPRVIAAPTSTTKKKKLVKPIEQTVDRPDATGVTSSSGQEGEKEEIPNEDVSFDSRDDQGDISKTSVFIGPQLPSHPTSTTAVLTLPQGLTRSPKIARVQPQVKPGKPVALVHPVVPDTPKKVSKVTHIKGLAGELNDTKTLQVTKPTWKPVGAPTPGSTSAPIPALTSTDHQTTPNLEMAEEKTDTQTGPSESVLATPPPLQEVVKKRKKHKKRRSHNKTDEEWEGSGRDRKHHKSEKSHKRSTHMYSEDSGEEDRPRKKRKKESRKERKRSRHNLHRKRGYSRSSSSSSYTDEESDRGRHRYESSSNRDRGIREGRKRREIGHREREEEVSFREERKHEGKQRYSSSSSQSYHKSRYRSPSPERSGRRKRNWSSLDSDDDSHSRHKSLEEDLHHVQKKHHHSSEHHHRHKHHDHHKSQHLSKTKSRCGSTSGSESKFSEGKMYSHSHCRSKYGTEGKHGRDRGFASILEEDVPSSYSGSPPSSELNSAGVRSAVQKRREGEVVPEVEWDSSLKGDGKRGHGVPVGDRWDGSRRHNVVDALTSHAPNQLGTKVKSWEGGANSVDAAALPGDWKRRERDSWDQELDKGKVKHVKKRRESEYPSKNPFQEFQNKKNAQTF